MFKRNVIANYLGQFYIAIIGIAIVPFYLDALGTEGYGLVGIFTMLQAWLQILDMGISTTLSREAARSKVSIENAVFFNKLKWSVLAIFLAIGVLLVTVFWCFRDWFATNWLDSTLSKETILLSLGAISVSVVFRWCSAPWRSTLVGLERQVILNVAQVFITTLRFPCSLIVLYLGDKKLESFFFYQLVVAIFEFVLYWILSNCLSVKVHGSAIPDRDFFKQALPTLKFALAVSFTSSVWVMVTQLDKLLLSSLISLEDYGYFSVAIMAAGGITMLSLPLAQAVLPRLTSLYADGKLDELQQQYRYASRMISAIVFPAAIILGAFSYEVILIWTGDDIIASSSSEILRWYAWGNGLLAISAFPYYLQYAYGNLKLHVIGNLIFAFVLFPSIWLATTYYGAVGAAKVWFVQNLFYFLFWTWLVHSNFLENFHFRWLIKDVLPFSLSCLTLAAFIRNVDFELLRFQWLMIIGMLFVFSLAFNIYKFRRCKHV